MNMKLEEIKLYNVKVHYGSGCLFQTPNTQECTYILTSKHLFEGVDFEEDGSEYEYREEDGTEISIKRLVENNNIWEEDEIPFTLIRGETYFPHKEADAVILKLELKLIGYDNLNICTNFDKINDYSLYGYPMQFETLDIGSQDTSYKILEKDLPANYLMGAQLVNKTLEKIQIEGMSGGAIIAVEDDYANIIGIQSQMKHPCWANGKIYFVPIRYFNEIIEYEEYSGKLSKLSPSFFENFDFLRDDSFALDVDFIDENKIAFTKQHLRNKALEVVKSDITPISIKELFRYNFLIDESENDCLNSKNIWLGWLEFLTIINIVKQENISLQQLEDLFKSIRLKYTHVQDCTTLFQSGLSKSDYLGLKEGGKVVIDSKNPPKRVFNILPGKMVDIVRAYDKKGFRTDRGIDPLKSFGFVHLNYFKEILINKMDEYANLTEIELFENLKQQYDELLK